MRILAFNCGSSSLKFDLLDIDGPLELCRVASGSVERIGVDAELSLTSDEHQIGRRLNVPGHDAASQAALLLLQEVGLLSKVHAVGHRVVHGGARFTEPALIDSGVLTAIGEATELAPLHNRPALQAITAAQKVLGASVPMVATFDTAFFAQLPDVAREYALPSELRQRFGLRRYGFHGLAHRYMIERYRLMRPDTQRARLITLQLGSGCSATASRDGMPLDTSMGLTPLEGLIMGTRSGDVDPMLPLWLVSHAAMSVDEVEDLLNSESGLLGLSGTSNDFRDLQKAASAGDEGAAFAVQSFCYRARKYLGAYLGVLGGADAIVLGGGIGERSVEAREQICAPFGWCGLELDAHRNRAVEKEDAFITTPDAHIEALVVHVDEASVIARDVFTCLSR